MPPHHKCFTASGLTGAPEPERQSRVGGTLAPEFDRQSRQPTTQKQESSFRPPIADSTQPEDAAVVGKGKGRAIGCGLERSSQPVAGQTSECALDEAAKAGGPSSSHRNLQLLSSTLLNRFDSTAEPLRQLNKVGKCVTHVELLPNKETDLVCAYDVTRIAVASTSATFSQRLNLLASQHSFPASFTRLSWCFHSLLRPRQPRPYP